MHRLIAIAAVLASPALGWGDAPAWLKQAAGRAAPAYDSATGAVVLFAEERVTVKPDGRVLTAVRRAVRIVHRGGRDEARAAVIYRTDGGEVRRLRGWMVDSSGGVKEYGKDQAVDVALVNNDIYNESRVRLISGAADASAGAVFGSESLLEDRSIFTQFSYAFQDDLAALTSRFVLELPDRWTARAVVHNHVGVDPVVTGTTHTWQLQNLPPVKDEPARPPLTSLVPRVSVSVFPPEGTSVPVRTFEDWRQVSAWLESLHAPRATPDAAVEERAKQLVEGKPTEFERIAAIAKFAQTVSYVSIQTGVSRGGGYTPHPAGEVLRKSYGDCKDKSNLMRAMLKAVGVESFPVAIFSGDRRFVRQDWPSPEQFNHAIIAVTVSPEINAPAVLQDKQFGRLLFFDPTDSYTPFGEIPEGQQNSLALIVAAEGGDLVRIPAVPPEGNLLQREVKAQLIEDGALRATVREFGTGSSASDNRAMRGRLPPDEYRKMIEHWVGRGAPGAALTSIEAGDEGGGFLICLEMLAPGYAKLMRNQLIVFKPAIVERHRATTFTGTERSYPVVLNADAYTETVEVELPAGFGVDEKPDPVALETTFGRYQAEWRAWDGKLYFNRALKIHNAVIAPADYAPMKIFFDQIVAAEQAPVVLSRQ